MDPAAYSKLSAALRRRAAGERAPISLAEADLSDARLARADLIGAELTGGRLDHANLSGAKLGKAELAAAQLRWADLNGADFTAANLSGADLSWARVEGACFADTDLRGASVNGATGEPHTIAGARIDHQMCQRSNLDDFDIIQLWRAGAIIVDVEAFSKRVRRACGMAQSDEPSSEAGPSSRRVSRAEVQALRNRLDGLSEFPAPPELAVSVVTPDSIPPAPPAQPRRALSMRSMRLVSDVLTEEMVQAPEWRRGDIVMGVTLLDMIGSGNAARVWSGRDEDGNELVVKIFDSARSEHGLALPAYRRGVQVINRLCHDRVTHPRVAKLWAVSLNQLGFVMDLAANGSALDLPALSWPVDSALKFFKQLAEAVGKAHQAGVLHRCIKPSNVLLDAELEPVLADFDMVDLPGLSAASAAAGGYANFAAPEELSGTGTQSPTADIYSLGSFLYFLLAGEPPPAPLWRRPSMAALPESSPGLARIILKCTATIPAERYQYVHELLADLDNHHDAKSVGLPLERATSGAESRVSGLDQSRPWLGHARHDSQRPTPARASHPPLSSSPPAARSEASDSPSRRPAAAKLGRAADVTTTLRSRRPAAAAQPGGTTVKLIATAGAVLVLVSLLIVEFSAPASKSIMAPPMRVVSAIGGGLMTLFLSVPQSQRLLWRLLLIVIAAGIMYMLDLPGLFATG